MVQWSDKVKAAPEGIVYLKKHTHFVPYLKDIVPALLTDENWNQATAALSEGQSLGTIARNLFECRQEDITYDNTAAHYAYLLQYMPFYAAEYELMYWDIADLLADRLWDEGVSVCSIGAGNLVDYWSLASAFAAWGWKRIDEQNAPGPLRVFMQKVSYLGIERVPWSYPFAFLECHKETCKACYGMDIASAEAAAAVVEANPQVYVFPKSLNELSVDAIKAVSQIIAHSTHPQVYVAVSLPAQEVDGRFATDAGKWKIDKLRDALKAEGCVLEGTPVREHKVGTSLTEEQANSPLFTERRWEHNILRPIWEKCDDKKHPRFWPTSNPDRLNWQIFTCTCPQDA